MNYNKIFEQVKILQDGNLQMAAERNDFNILTESRTFLEGIECGCCEDHDLWEAGYNKALQEVMDLFICNEE